MLRRIAGVERAAANGRDMGKAIQAIQRDLAMYLAKFQGSHKVGAGEEAGAQV